MLKIRFQRVGRKNRPHFRLVLSDSRVSAKKKAKEILGWRYPIKKTQEVDKERVTHWLSVGAKTSDTAHNFLISTGAITGKKIPVHKKSKKTKEAVAAPAGAPGVVPETKQTAEPAPTATAVVAEKQAAEPAKAPAAAEPAA